MLLPSRLSTVSIMCVRSGNVNPESVLYELSQLLNTQLDKETLATCVGMIENGVNPDALAVRPR
jgi:Mitotic-spindle organizing gamma-tubulin ring associated